LKFMKDHVVVDFIVQHQIDDIPELEISYLTITLGLSISMDRFAMKGKRLP
jgi:hypothetical protein